MIRAIRPSAMAQDDASLVSGWNVAPNVGYTVVLTPGPSACGVLLFDAGMMTAIASGAGLVGTDQPVILLPQTGQSLGMVDAELGWHLLLTTTGTEAQRTIRIGPAVDLPDEIHPLYQDDALALARATAAINAGASYVDDVSVTCPLGLGVGIGGVASAPVDGTAVVGQVESVTWSGAPDGTGETAVIRRHTPIAPEAYVPPLPPPILVDDTAETDAVTAASGNVLANDTGTLTVVAVNGLSANVGEEIAGSAGGVFTIAEDGAWTFDPSGDFAALSGSATATTSVSYHASNGDAEASATLTVTVSAVAVPVPTDPYWANVTLCINPAGIAGSTSITCAKGRTITVGGSAQIATNLGYPTILFDGSADWVKIAANAGLQFGSGNFTIDVHVRKIANVVGTSRLWNSDGDFAHGIDILIDGSGKLAIYASTNGASWNLLAAPNVASLANDTDYFIRIVRDGGTLRCGINGTVYIVSTGLGAATLFNGGRDICFGGQSVGISRSLNGHIRGYRVTKGVARDASDVPSLPFPTA